MRVAGLAQLTDLARQDLIAARQLLDEALPHHQAALKTNPSNTTYRNFLRNNRSGLALVLADLGDHALAADTAEQLMQAAVNPAEDFFSAACFLARCVQLAEQDPQLSLARRHELARQYSDQAMAVLRQAVGKGYSDVTHMKKISDVDALRSREDFKHLLVELEGRAKP